MVGATSEVEEIVTFLAVEFANLIGALRATYRYG